MVFPDDKQQENVQIPAFLRIEKFFKIEKCTVIIDLD